MLLRTDASVRIEENGTVGFFTMAYEVHAKDIEHRPIDGFLYKSRRRSDTCGNHGRNHTDSKGQGVGPLTRAKLPKELRAQGLNRAEACVSAFSSFRDVWPTAPSVHRTAADALLS